MSKSKRRSERIPGSLPVRWIRKSGIIETTAADINLHGMFVRSAPGRIKPGEMLQLQVVLPDGNLDVFVVARFVGQTESGAGVGVEIFVMDELAQTGWSH